MSGVLSSALAVEVLPTGGTGASIEAGVGGTGADGRLAVGAHEGRGTPAEEAWRTRDSTGIETKKWTVACNGIHHSDESIRTH